MVRNRDNPTQAHDSAASDLYKLIGEIFDIKGIFKWFRKTFITFVKISTGKSVNRFVTVYKQIALIFFLDFGR